MNNEFLLIIDNVNLYFFAGLMLSFMFFLIIILIDIQRDINNINNRDKEYKNKILEQ